MLHNRVWSLPPSATRARVALCAPCARARRGRAVRRGAAFFGCARSACRLHQTLEVRRIRPLRVKIIRHRHHINELVMSWRPSNRMRAASRINTPLRNGINRQWTQQILFDFSIFDNYIACIRATICRMCAIPAAVRWTLIGRNAGFIYTWWPL